MNAEIIGLIRQWNTDRAYIEKARETLANATRAEQATAEELARALDGREAVYRDRCYTAKGAHGLIPAEVTARPVVILAEPEDDAQAVADELARHFELIQPGQPVELDQADPAQGEQGQGEEQQGRS